MASTTTDVHQRKPSIGATRQSGGSVQARNPRFVHINFQWLSRGHHLMWQTASTSMHVSGGCGSVRMNATLWSRRPGGMDARTLTHGAQLCDSGCLHPWSQLDCPLTVQDARTHGTGSGHASVDVDAVVGPIRCASNSRSSRHRVP